MTPAPDPRIAAMETDMQAMQVALFDLLDRAIALQTAMNKLRQKVRKALKSYPHSSQNQPLSNEGEDPQNSSAEQGVGAPEPGLTDNPSLKRRDL